MTIHVVEHPLVDDVLAALRDETTPPSRFRLLTKQITMLVAVEATADLPVRRERVRTPLEEAEVRRLAADIVLVPILRAGLGMLDVMLQLLPNATVGHVGLERDEETAVAREYYRKLPPLQERIVLILDPMLATGGSARAAIGLLDEHGAKDVRLLSIVAAPEGIDLLATHCPNVSIYTAAVDRGLNDQKFILPGLGDFGDRLYGTQFG
ncbi:MAG TPA: uracil phosphoribosyltransferase [Vicinamibacteria bacterium]|nr:uracil phosphoribosyltransferase [Vicinamibacteria bacterium]